MKWNLWTAVMLGADVLSAPPGDGASAGPAGGGDTQSSGADDGADTGDLDAGDAQGDDAGDDADARDAAGREDDDEDLLDDESDEDRARNLEERFKKVQAKNRKLRRRYSKAAPILSRLKDVDLDDLMRRASNYRDVEEAARRNPKLRALLGGGDDADDDARDEPRRGRKDADDQEWDEKKVDFGFDPNENKANRFVANMARENHTLKRELRALTQRLDGMERGGRERDERSEKTQWTEALRAVGTKITDTKIAELVQDAIRGAYRDPNARKLGAQQILAFYLKKYGASPDQARRAQDASKQRIAERNKSLPQHARQGGTPAGARPKGERLVDVGRRLIKTR